MMDRETPAARVGTELATWVAVQLERGGSLVYGHRDYGGMGLRYAGGVYVYGEVVDGDLPAAGEPIPWQGGYGDERRCFSSRAEFVAWLAAQSDESLSGQDLGWEWLRGNQRLTLERLRGFVAAAWDGRQFLRADTSKPPPPL